MRIFQKKEKEKILFFFLSNFEITSTFTFHVTFRLPDEPPCYVSDPGVKVILSLRITTWAKGVTCFSLLISNGNSINVISGESNYREQGPTNQTMVINEMIFY